MCDDGFLLGACRNDGVFLGVGFIAVLDVVIVRMRGRIEGFLHCVIPECCYRESMCDDGFLLRACRNDGVFLVWVCWGAGCGDCEDGRAN